MPAELEDRFTSQQALRPHPQSWAAVARGISTRSIPPSLWVGLFLTAVLMAVSGRYGPHRDELYFVEAGENLSWAYPDQGVLTPLVAQTMEEIAPAHWLPYGCRRR